MGFLVAPDDFVFLEPIRIPCIVKTAYLNDCRMTHQKTLTKMAFSEFFGVHLSKLSYTSGHYSKATLFPSVCPRLGRYESTTP
jgi:hypothetical protein